MTLEPLRAGGRVTKRPQEGDAPITVVALPPENCVPQNRWTPRRDAPAPDVELATARRGQAASVRPSKQAQGPSLVPAVIVEDDAAQRELPPYTNGWWPRLLPALRGRRLLRRIGHSHTDASAARPPNLR